MGSSLGFWPLKNTNASTRIINAGDGPTTVVNLDSVNTVYLSYNNPVAIGDPEHTLPLSPSTAASFSGEQDVYATTDVGKTANLGFGTDLQSLVPGSISILGNVNATVSGSVSITGTPSVTISGTPTVTINNASIAITSAAPLDVSAATVNVNGVGGIFPPGSQAQLATTSNQTISSLAPYNTAVINVQNYLSYHIVVSSYCGSQGTAAAPLVGQIILTWYADAAGTIPIYSERWYGWLGNGSGAIAPIYGSGPMAGPYMKVTIGNLSATNYTLSSLTLWGSGRTYNSPRWRQNPPSAMTTGLSTIQSMPGSYGDDNILFSLNNLNIGASQSLWQPLPLVTGRMFVLFQTSATLANNFALGQAGGLNPLTSGNIVFGTAANGVLFNPASVASTGYTTEFVTPRAPCYVTLHTSTTAPNVTLQCVGQEAP